jgi:hypothetical protein
MKFNIIGFSNYENKENKHCVHHQGTRLIQDLYDPDKLFCPTCGVSYLPKDTGIDEKVKIRHSPEGQQSRIISPKKKKKYYDKQGHEITDPSVIADIQSGKTIIYYNEFLPPETK